MISPTHITDKMVEGYVHLEGVTQACAKQTKLDNQTGNLTHYTLGNNNTIRIICNLAKTLLFGEVFKPTTLRWTTHQRNLMFRIKF